MGVLYDWTGHKDTFAFYLPPDGTVLLDGALQVYVLKCLTGCRGWVLRLRTRGGELTMRTPEGKAPGSALLEFEEELLIGDVEFVPGAGT